MSNLKNLPFTASQLSSILDEIGGDGHTIWDAPAIAKEQGLPEGVFDRWTKDHASDDNDGSGKGVITAKGGEVVEAMKGMYGLQFLKYVAYELGVDYMDYYGRGSQAREITAQLRKYLKTVEA
jgi:hypothetical protein